MIFIHIDVFNFIIIEFESKQCVDWIKQRKKNIIRMPSPKASSKKSCIHYIPHINNTYTFICVYSSCDRILLKFVLKFNEHLKSWWKIEWSVRWNSSVLSLYELRRHAKVNNL